MVKKRDKGQSTLEYVIILTAIIAAILLVAANAVKPKVESSLNGTVGKMDGKIETIDFGGGAGAGAGGAES